MRPGNPSIPDDAVDEWPRAGDFGYRQEVWRKLLHLFALAIPVGYHFVDRSTAVTITGLCCLVSITVDLARFRGWPVQRFWKPITAPIIRAKETANFTGATYILTSAWLCPLLFDRTAAAAGMVAIITGDIAAALIGKRWGRHRIVGNRTMEGSSAFFLAAGAGLALVPGVSPLMGLSLGLFAAVVEAISGPVDDNLSVPLVVGLACHLWLTGA